MKPITATCATPARLNRSEFDAAWLRLRPQTLRYAASLTNRNNAEDLVQETYLLGLQLLAHYDPATGEAGLHRWLCAILLNLHRTLQNQIARRRDEALAHEQAKQIPDPAPDPEDAEAAALLCLLESYQIHCLHRRRRDIWQLYRQGLKQAEIAAALGITQPTVSYHVSIIVQELRASAGSLIIPADGYPNAEVLFHAMSQVSIYRAPCRTGSGLATAKLRRLKY